LRLDRVSAVGLELLVATYSDAVSLAGKALADQVTRIYRSLVCSLGDEELHPWRFWNYIPDIHRPARTFARRYEAFNAGRYDAFRQIYAARGEWPLVPASAVGHQGRDLAVYLLASNVPGRPGENPRQIPAFQYSREYGEFPPCFARGIRIPQPLPGVEGSASGIVSGTASIVGETSRHMGDVDGQTAETLANLARLSFELARDPDAPSERWTASRAQELRSLERYRDVRAYVVRSADGPKIGATLCKALPRLRRMELIQADLCRPELLVEVEGILDFGL
jgi:chorismate lyase/3-hydroxybenzoate synthase